MKVPVAALFLLTLILTTPASHSQPRTPESVNAPAACCLMYIKRVVPRRQVVGYRSALDCPLPAIIFVNRNNQEICADPNKRWVQAYIKDPRLPSLPSTHAV